MNSTYLGERGVSDDSLMIRFCLGSSLGIYRHGTLKFYLILYDCLVAMFWA